jgi:L-fucose mutarotase
MLKGTLLHPQILEALARAGHGSRVLVSDGNFPHGTKRGRNAALVFLNLAPGTVRATDVLRAIVGAIPIEAAAVMTPAHAPDPEIWRDFVSILQGAGAPHDLARLDREAFYRAASDDDVCLTIATGEQRIYANLLLTIGVVPP